MVLTMLYAGVLALLLLVISIRVTQARGQEKVFMGDGGNALVLRRMRGQANFIEYVPMTLLLVGFLEMQGAPTWELHALLGTLLFARLLHAYTFSFSTFFVPGRVGGATLTWVVMGLSALLCIWQGWKVL